MSLSLARCTECDLVYAPTIPNNTFLLKAYAEAAYDSGIEAYLAARSYANEMAPYVDRLVGRNAAVDVGAGSGPLLPLLNAIGFYPVIGIEPSRAAIMDAPPAVRHMLREGMFSPALIADVRTSLVCSFMTLEHIAKPKEFVESVFNLLEPGGMFAVVVHNWRAPLNRILGMHSPIIDVQHLQLFNPKSLRTLLARSGFISIDIKSISNIYPLRYWFRLTPLPRFLKIQLAKLLEQIGLSNLKVSLQVGNILAIAFKPF